MLHIEPHFEPIVVFCLENQLLALSVCSVMIDAETMTGFLQKTHHKKRYHERLFFYVLKDLIGSYLFECLWIFDIASISVKITCAHTHTTHSTMP